MELGISTFVETTPDFQTGKTVSHAQRIREVVEEIILADQVGLDVFGVGEHHREDFAASNPAVVLAACGNANKEYSSDKCRNCSFIGRSCSCVSRFCDIRWPF
ncbi:LLM class flavin-dependent oxidoreductase [Bacillus sp. 4A_MP2]